MARAASLVGMCSEVAQWFISQHNSLAEKHGLAGRIVFWSLFSALVIVLFKVGSFLVSFGWNLLVATVTIALIVIGVYALWQWLQAFDS